MTSDTAEAVEREGFLTAWEAFFRAVRRAKGRAALASGREVSLAQYALLEPLVDGSVSSVGELARAAGVAQPTASRMVESLVKAGHVTRRAAADDRRRVLIALTGDGVRAMREKAARVAAARARVHDSLTAEERRQAAVLLRRLAKIIEEEL